MNFLNDLILKFDKIRVLSGDCKLAFVDAVTETVIPKDHYLLRPGEVCDKLSFVAWGMLRGFETVNGKEVTTRFASMEDICIDPHSFYLQLPSSESITAVHQTTLFQLSFEQTQSMANEFLDFRIMMERILWKDYLICDANLKAVRCQSAKERFASIGDAKWLKADAPFDTYLASYLGISQQSMRKYKKQLLMPTKSRRTK